MSSKSSVRGGKQQDLSLIETMRWEPDSGIIRLEQHLRRLKRSADALGFLPAPTDLVDQMEAAVGGNSPLRLRLEMTFRGKTEITTTPFSPLPVDAVWRVAIARARIASDDPMFRHKTSRREVYQLARDEYPVDEIDEVILLNERDEVCEGTITNVFVQAEDNMLKTPALTCGLLAGVLRGELIRQGKAKAELLREKDLAGAGIYVGNSLRGLIRAVLVQP